MFAEMPLDNRTVNKSRPSPLLLLSQATGALPPAKRP